MKHMDITLVLLINAMAIFVLAAAVTSFGPSDPVNRAPDIPRDTREYEHKPVAPAAEPAGRVKQ